MLLADAHSGRAAHVGAEVRLWRRGTAGSILACVLLLDSSYASDEYQCPNGGLAIEICEHLQDAGHGW